MKLFNVRLHVQITEIGVVGERDADAQPPLESLIHDRQNDSPLKDAAKLMDGYLARVTAPQKFPFYTSSANGDDAVNMTENVHIAASSFEELQAILAKFHGTAQSISVEAIR